jgi:hypothetical protein
MFMVREDSRWRFFVIPRERLFTLHSHWLATPKRGPGARPKSHHEARSDNLTITIRLGPDPELWDTSLKEFDGEWPLELPELKDGPGRVGGP